MGVIFITNLAFERFFFAVFSVMCSQLGHGIKALLAMTTYNPILEFLLVVFQQGG
jgi:hypothetical protein